MPPALASLLEFLGPLIAAEVDLHALEATVVGYEWSHPMKNPVPAIIENADTIFPDANVRPVLVALMSLLHTKAAGAAAA